MGMESLFYPRAVAVIGSMAEGKLGYELVRQVVEGGFRQVFAVNPKAQGGFGVSGHTSVTAIGQPVDLAIVASPAATVADVLEDCGQAGVTAAVVITAGFSEAGNTTAEAKIKEIAARHGIRIVGPNCAGMANTAHDLYPTLETRPPRGHTALLSQSGALAGAVLSWAQQQGLGFSKFVSFGNRADLDEVELLPYLADDPETRVVALYLESVVDGRRFMQALQACCEKKPVVVVKAGRTRTGQRATLSHTGSMAGSDVVYDAALRACGAIRVASIEELFDVCKGFAYLPPVRGRRVAIVTNSGGPGVLAADAAEDLGLALAEPGPELRQKLTTFLPSFCAFKNPIDLTVEGTEAGYRETLLALLGGDPASGGYDAALALNVAPPYLDSVPLARGICDAAERTGKPIVATFMSGETVAKGVAYLADHGVPNLPTGERAVNVLRKVGIYYAARERPRPLQETLTTTHAARGQVLAESERPLLPGDDPILEPDAMDWLQKNGIPVPQFRTGATRTEALEGCRAIGYPVVMKVVSPDILHKSDRGGVVVGIADDEAAWSAFAGIQQAAAGADFRGVVIYPMIRDAQEVLVGLSRDPQFGPVIAFGLGGIYTELLHDVVFRVAPIDCDAAWEMMHELKSFQILAGSRGRKPTDLAALARLLAMVSELPLDYPEISELDLNPVFALPDGVVVGDVRIIKQLETRTR